MRGNFVDRLLARVDGELATIWITELITTDDKPDLEKLRRAFRQLVEETPRLHLAWDPISADWIVRRRTEREIDEALRAWSTPRSDHEHTHALLREPLDLSCELPLRLTLAERTDERWGRWLLAIQLHHAIGDARSLMYLNRRLWQLVTDQPHAGPALGQSAMTDRKALVATLRRASALTQLVQAKSRVLARRGQPLTRRATHIGAPMLSTLRVVLPDNTTPEKKSELYFGSLLAAVLSDPRASSWEQPIRLRVPVDLRRELSIGITLENACSAVPIEVPQEKLREQLRKAPARLGALVTDELHRALSRGAHWATVLEVMAVSRLASTSTLRSHARPDLLATTRASTWVTTYVGSIDRYVADAPFEILTLRTHTPTWGSNGHCLRNALSIHLSAFETLNDPSDLSRSIHAMKAWLSTHHEITSDEVGGCST